MSNRVFVLSGAFRPLMPCCPSRARQLLKSGKAAIYRRYPFTIILKHREEGEVQPVRLKVDPGSKISGLAIATESDSGASVVFAAEIEHRGQNIRNAMDARAMRRRSRRLRKTRYRPCRSSNRTRPADWLPPSLGSRVANIVTWVSRIRRFCPVSDLSMELVRFDLQKMENPEISGIEYQQGTLKGYEVREYLLEKWGRKCAYCGKTDIPLQVEHIHPKSKGGSDRVSNLAIACVSCNQNKGSRSIEEFLKGNPGVLAKIAQQAKAPLKDAAAVNSTRWALWQKLSSVGLPAECSSGGRTKFNRTTQEYPKAHWIDAACVGVSGSKVHLVASQEILTIKATGRGKHQICRTDKHGFPVRWCMRSKKVNGFQTGDMVIADMPTGKHAGVHVGRVIVRATGQFKVGLVNVRSKHVRILHRADGYQYQ